MASDQRIKELDAKCIDLELKIKELQLKVQALESLMIPRQKLGLHSAKPQI